MYSTHTVCTMYYILVQFVCIVEQLQMHWDIMRLTYCERNKFSENYLFQIYIFIKQKSNFTLQIKIIFFVYQIGKYTQNK